MSFPPNEFKVYTDNDYIVIESTTDTLNWRELKGNIIIEPYPDPTMGGF